MTSEDFQYQTSQIKFVVIFIEAFKQLTFLEPIRSKIYADFLVRIVKMSETKSITVAFILNDLACGAYDAATPEYGNPGIGGTQYCFIALATELAKGTNGIKPILFHNNCEAIIAPYLKSVCIKGGDEEIALAALAHKPNLAVVRGDSNILKNPLFKQDKIPLIAWVHNHLHRNVLNALGRANSICHIVFCGLEQRMLAFDSLCFTKSSSIFNLHYSVEPKKKNFRNPTAAVYIGSVIPSKGLHRILRLWPKIKNKCPTATLHVIGSGALYDSKANLGPNELAEYKYENKLFNYLDNNPQKYGVTFHGLLKKEKYEVLEFCSVGIPNPTALTECCPGSVLECSAAKLALVGNNKFGMVDTIVNNKTGYIVDSDSEMINKIVYLFQNHNQVLTMGEAGAGFVKNQFDALNIANKWGKLIKDFVLEGAYSETNNQFLLRGKYRYRHLIEKNIAGKSPLLAVLKDVIAKIEVVESKFR
jgi:glycosyltransferase involved in cell wall biosynthesis